MQLDIKSTRNRRIIDFRKFGFNDLQVLGRYNYNRSESKLPSHVHKDMIEICYYDKGSQYFEVSGEKYLVKGGDIFINYPGEEHGSGEHPEEKGVLYWLIIKVNTNSSDNLALLCKYLIAMNIRHFKGGKKLKKILEDIFLILDKKEPQHLKKIRISLAIQSLILSLLDYMENNKNETDNLRLQRVLNYIDNHIPGHISIIQLANEIHLSESRFKNFFKEVTGFTPGDFIQRKKVEFAIEKIKNDPDISLSELAYELEFSSPQYFSTVFKKYTGKSPSFLLSK
ncbi:AraC family transcriptional regulator [Chitinophagaceae bacterium LB-8]|uniref:AraC family transcriptional regulator n=1 Tax=Paraflavisolibacter caeni TaxID=2982496 RepID=A0A9X2XYD9_9BACT|nr:AraC family transcriptional regulator [Paraflavisolibacter caeni]MCU7551854.1 AraC family transcriptional regulator [Paraflavisolibacter caeni]